MNKELVSLIVWTDLFLLFELPAHFWSGCPWYTLSRTVWNGEAWWPPVALYVAGFTAILLGHLEWHWSARWLIVAAFVGACLIASHALEKALSHFA